MKELLRCRAMESMCRQRASFYPEEAWRFLAEAEMWHHKAMDAIAAHHVDCNQSLDDLMKNPAALSTAAGGSNGLAGVSRV